MQTQVLIIGAGVTGTGLARDLAMRGVTSIVVEKQDINAGASGGNHGLLHSGARYVVSDPSSALECSRENQILKQMAPHCIESTGGLFVAIPGDDEQYITGFAEACGRCRIPARPVDLKDALEMEPSLSPRIIAAFAVEDATIDPFKLSLDNMAYAQQHGARLLRHSCVVGVDSCNGCIQRVRVRDNLTGQISVIEAEVVVNAAGAWAGVVAALAGANIPMRYSKGTLLVTQQRLAQRVINRLRLAASGDILVPAGTVSILGTSSERVDSPDVIYPEIHEVDAMIDDGRTMVPALADTRYIRAYCGVRPLVAGSGQAQDDRAVSRGFVLIDHGEGPAPIANFISITGGKLTTYRLMAEKTADLVCAKLGVKAAGRTRTEPLANTTDARWTQPGLAPDMWLQKHDLKDILLCECEMVPQSVADDLVASIRRQGGRPSLKAIGLRSRIGKGPCQGTFCSLRLAAHLYNRGHLADPNGVEELRAFLRERWRGQQPLLWDTALAQAELLEAMHCGLFCLEIE
ncbi:MAG: anaerobic glycerol-3-phosphate dehydrogenase subunit GlpA [Desulfobacteraceae bacterium]|nr:anaerobic glycerol-3-phosphate dehydrogenase subunit GlpA [Desulfobacteraceae bacterium]